MHVPTRVKKFAGAGLLALALVLSIFGGAMSRVPAAHAGFGPPPDLTGPLLDPTATPTPITIP